MPSHPASTLFTTTRRIAWSAVLSTFSCAASAAEPETALIWPDGPPGEQHPPTVQQVTERSQPPALRDRIVTGITAPHVTIFRAPRPNGVALLMIPGGGYQRVVLDKEGYETAEWFAARGVTSFVLVYRLPGEHWSAGADTPLQDTQRALRWIREHAGEFALDPRRVGVIGFSAGGHAAATLITRFDDPVYAPVDAADQRSARPDFAALIYPVISMRDGVAHSGSRERLLGEAWRPEDIAANSPELQVSPRTPPTFLLHATDDTSVPAENSLLMNAALRQAGVPAELHLFAEGGHGFGLRYVGNQPVAAWPNLLLAWMEALP
jgi:acetyl esterase/lipase